MVPRWIPLRLAQLWRVTCLPVMGPPSSARAWQGPEGSRALDAGSAKEGLTAALPLHGRRIVVTRAREQSQGLVARLHQLGAEVVECPAITIVPPEDYAEIDAAI